MPEKILASRITNDMLPARFTWETGGVMVTMEVASIDQRIEGTELFKSGAPTGVIIKPHIPVLVESTKKVEVSDLWPDLNNVYLQSIFERLNSVSRKEIEWAVEHAPHENAYKISLDTISRAGKKGYRQQLLDLRDNLDAILGGLEDVFAVNSGEFYVMVENAMFACVMSHIGYMLYDDWHAMVDPWENLMGYTLNADRDFLYSERLSL